MGGGAGAASLVLDAYAEDGSVLGSEMMCLNDPRGLVQTGANVAFKLGMVRLPKSSEKTSYPGENIMYSNSMMHAARRYQARVGACTVQRAGGSTQRHHCTTTTLQR